MQLLCAKFSSYGHAEQGWAGGRGVCLYSLHACPSVLLSAGCQADNQRSWVDAGRTPQHSAARACVFLSSSSSSAVGTGPCQLGCLWAVWWGLWGEGWDDARSQEPKSTYVRSETPLMGTWDAEGVLLQQSNTFWAMICQELALLLATAAQSQCHHITSAALLSWPACCCSAASAIGSAV